MGAKGTALGGASSAAISGVDAIYWNPAGIANTTSSVEAMFSYMKYLADINVTYGAVAVRTGLGSVGVSIQSLSFGDIPITTENSPDGTGSMYAPSFMTFGASYSRSMTDRIFVGATVKYVTEQIMSTSASAFALDMGVQYKTQYGFRLGVAMKNVGTPLKYDGNDMERQVDLPGTPAGSPPRALRITAQKSELPSTFEVGLSYDRKFAERFGFAVMGNYRYNTVLDDEYTLGAEMNLNEMLFLRAGYTYAETDEDVAGGKSFIYGPSGGFGLMYPVTQQMKIAFDFAYRTAEYFDDPLIFTAKLIF
jgi:long-subunit fatty acid transport protein